MNKVIVTGDDAGNIIVQSKKNAEFGHIRVEQLRIALDENGFARPKNVSALILGKISDLKLFGFHKGQELEGTIISKEQLTPFNSREPERDYKIAGKSGVVCTVNGQPMYRKNFYKTSASEEDVYVRDENNQIVNHDNKEAIQAAYAALNEASETEKSSEEVVTDESLNDL